MITTLDRVRETRRQRSAFRQVRRAEVEYARKLRAVARHVGTLVRGLADHAAADVGVIVAALRGYADLIEPWAAATANRMLQDVSRRDLRAWHSHGARLSAALRLEVNAAPVGVLMRQRLAEQVDLITSLPREAAERVQALALEARVTGTRAGEIRGAVSSAPDLLARRIYETGEVTVGRANLIARTETSRTAAELVRARAEHIGSAGYIWRTAGDSEVRPRHRRLNGRYFAWDDPPVTGENGERSLPGAIFNCRCFAEPLIPGAEEIG